MAAGEGGGELSGSAKDTARLDRGGETNHGSIDIFYETNHGSMDIFYDVEKSKKIRDIFYLGV